MVSVAIETVEVTNLPATLGSICGQAHFCPPVTKPNALASLQLLVLEFPDKLLTTNQVVPWGSVTLMLLTVGGLPDVVLPVPRQSHALLALVPTVVPKATQELVELVAGAALPGLEGLLPTAIA